MRTKRRFKKWTKNTGVIIIALVLYSLLGNYGYLASTSQLGGIIIPLGWVALMFGTPTTLYFINEEK